MIRLDERGRKKGRSFDHSSVHKRGQTVGSSIKTNYTCKFVWLDELKLFPLGEFVCANREKSNLIGWRQTLTTSPPNHIRFLLVRAKKIAMWKTDLSTGTVDSSSDGWFVCLPAFIHKWSDEYLFFAQVRPDSSSVSSIGYASLPSCMLYVFKFSLHKLFLVCSRTTII